MTVRETGACTLLLISMLFGEVDQGPDLILKSAHYQECSFYEDELECVLKDNVIFHYDSAVIRSELAKWWKGRGEVILHKNVEVTQDEQIITCDRVHFKQKQDVLIAEGDVVFVDHDEGIRITGNRCTYDLASRFCVLEGQPHFFRYDTAAAETLTIVGRKMLYNDSLQKTTVINDVVVTKGALRSICDTAFYFSEKDLALMRVDPEMIYEEHVLDGDSVDIFFKGDTIEGMSVVGKGHGIYFDKAKLDTTITHVWGDSIYMALSDSGYMDSVWIIGSVESKYYQVADSTRPNNVTGKHMILDFGEKSRIDNARLWGNAESVYYLDEEQNSGRNEASGDTLSVWFEDGKAVRLRLLGGVRGAYFP
ncbi:MAG: hypothetical protein GF398_14950 [Chitinivibrionales bacterium]|nr:hypothetical protein [Chitinivibrionales bacterium]